MSISLRGSTKNALGAGCVKTSQYLIFIFSVDVDVFDFILSFLLVTMIWADETSFYPRKELGWKNGFSDGH